MPGIYKRELKDHFPFAFFEKENLKKLATFKIPNRDAFLDDLISQYYLITSLQTSGHVRTH